jgi:hypothetical protein
MHVDTYQKLRDLIADEEEEKREGSRDREMQVRAATSDTSG